jgi:uncharacterized protein
MIILPITLTIAGACALLHLWLASRIVRARRPLKISVGDGGDEGVLRRMRAHANFAENTPLFLILLGLIEIAGGDKNILWGVGIAFVLARIAHGFGMDRRELGRWRMIGSVLSTILLLGLAGWALSFAYREPLSRGQQIQLGPGRSAELPPAPNG